MQLIYKLLDSDPDFGFRNLRDTIWHDDFADDLDKGKYHEMIASVFIYQQVIEELLRALISKHEMYVLAGLFPIKYEINECKVQYFGQVVEKVKDIFDFEKKNELINLCKEVNSMRNVLAHSMIKSDKHKITEKCQNIEKIYRKIHEICQEQNYLFQDVIQEKLNNAGQYLISKVDEYKRDLEEIEKIIKKNRKKEHLFCNLDWDTRKYCLLYIFLFEFVRVGLVSTKPLNLMISYTGDEILRDIDTKCLNEIGIFIS